MGKIAQLLAELASADITPERRDAILVEFGQVDSSITAEQITEALAAIDEHSRALAVADPTPGVVAGVKGLVAHKKALLAARQAQAELAEQHRASLAELDSTHDPARDHIQPDPDKAAMPEPDAGNTPDEPEDDKSAQGKGDDTKTKAKAKRDLSALDKGDTAPTDRAAVVTVTPQISGNIPGLTTGDKIVGDGQLIAAFAAKAQALASPGAPGRHDVARLSFNYPPERTFREGAEDDNLNKLEAVRAPSAMTAAGLCLPLETRTEIEVIGVTDRPVKGALTGFQTERGGLTYRGPFDALAMASGMGVWTQEDDLAVDPDDELTPRKSCLPVTCPGTLEASIYSTYLCLQFPNMTARFDREWVRATTESSMVAWARFAENQLLTRLFAGSKTVAGVHQLGAVRDCLLNYDRIQAYYRNRHRLNDSVALHTIAPRWMIDLLRSDLAMQMTNASPAELFGIARAALESWFRTRNINVTWHLDGLAGVTANGVVIPNQYYDNVAAGATVPAFPAKADCLLYREGDWLFLDGGTLDLGLVRDSRLNLMNRYQTFVETFEGVAFVGKECLRLVLPIVPSGASSGTIDPHDLDATLPAAA